MKKQNIVIGCLLCFVLYSCNKNVDETVAIKALLEKESATWRSGDVAGHAACWQVQPYSRILVSAGNGEVYDVPPANMLEGAEGMGNGGSSLNSNYQWAINGDTGWVSHSETSTSVTGVQTKSFEIRLVEKINGNWKLVGQSIHILK